MKNRVFLVFFVVFVVFLSGMAYAQSSSTDVKVGDVFTIAEVQNNNYEHINYPRTNFIIKKGGIADYDSLKGKKIEIYSIKEDKDGSLVATIMLASKKMFFNSHKYVTVSLNEAIEDKELLKI